MADAGLAVQRALGGHQKDVCVAHHREVGVDKALRLAGRTIGSDVLVFLEGDAVGEGAEGVDARGLALGPEDGARVLADLELVVELLGHAAAFPTGRNAEVVDVHLAAGKGEDQIIGDTVGLGIVAVLLDGKDDFVRTLVVVGEEKLLIGAVDAAGGLGMQAVAVVHEVFQHVSALLPLGRAGVDLGVEVELGEDELDGPLVDAAVLGGTGCGEGAVVDDVGQFGLQPVVQVGAFDLLRLLGDLGILVSEGDVAEIVQGVIVAQGTQGAGLGDIFVLCREGQFRSFGLADEFIALGNLEEHTGIGGIDKAGGLIPEHLAYVGYAFIAPTADIHVRREFADMEHTADILAHTAVQSLDGRVAVRAVVTGGGIPGIDARQEGAEAFFRGESLVGRIFVRVDRGDVKILDAGGQGCRNRENSEDIFDGFHMLSWIRS